MFDYTAVNVSVAGVDNSQPELLILLYCNF